MDSSARALQRRDQRGGGLDEQVGGPGQGGAQGGVDHVGRGEPVVDPRALGLADGLLDHVDEGGHVVVGDPLALVHRLDEGGVDLGALGPAERGGVGRHVADLRPAVGGQQLDLEPHGEPGLVGEERGHLRRGVAGDHRAASAFDGPAARARPGRVERPSRAMSVRCCTPGQRWRPPRRRRGPGPRRVSPPRAVTPSTRPPAVTTPPASAGSAGGAGVEHGHPGYRRRPSSRPAMRSPVRGDSG